MMQTRLLLLFAVLVVDSSAAMAGTTEVQLGPRPFYLIDALDEGPLKDKLSACSAGPFRSSDFSIGHRGAPLQFPEHTKESYKAAARMGAGIIECDVTFTKDRELVCRHSQCDLHTTTNILAVPELAAKCSKPFTSAKLNPNTGEIVTPASARCCTSDITKDEFLSLNGKMDASDRSAQTVADYLAGTASFRTDLYSGRGTLMTHAQSISLFKQLGVKMTPELKSAAVDMPFENEYSQQEYAQQLVDEYRAANVSAEDVWLQSFNLTDIRYWIENAGDFADQAVYLDGRYSNRKFKSDDKSSWEPSMAELVASGVNYIAPPLWVLLQSSDTHEILPSVYASEARKSGLKIITWTLERSGLLGEGGGWYYQTIKNLINDDGDMLTVLDTLTQDVGVVGVFSDWPAAVTYYANCMDL